MDPASPRHGPTNPSPESVARSGVRRFGTVVELVPEKEAWYRELHADAWPGVVERMRLSNVRNFSIFTTELAGRKYLFGYYEYTGDDYEADMRALAEDPETRRWWAETDPCQRPLPNRKPGAHWTEMEPLFLALPPEG